MKKILVTFMSMLLVFGFLLTSVSAATSTIKQTKSWNYGSSYNGTPYGSYSPYKGTTIERMVVESPTLATFSFDTYFTFNTNIVNKLADYRNNNNYHFTLDVANTNDYDKTMDANYVYTTLPNPKMDLEDDPWPFGNGYKDEAEVVARDLVSANVEYTMYAHFRDHRNVNPTSSQVDITGAISEKSLLGEYNTVNYYPYLKFDISSVYQAK